MLLKKRQNLIIEHISGCDGRFGGIKLGTSGLINAYKSASFDVISKSKILIHIIKSIYEISYNYQNMNDVMRIIKEHKIEILKTDFQVHCKLLLAVEKRKEIEQIKETEPIEVDDKKKSKKARENIKVKKTTLKNKKQLKIEE